MIGDDYAELRAEALKSVECMERCREAIRQIIELANVNDATRDIFRGVGIALNHSATGLRLTANKTAQKQST